MADDKPIPDPESFEVPDGDFDFTHEEGETFSFLFDGTLVAEMSLGGVRLYGEHAADLSAKAFWKAMLVHNPYQGIVGRLTTRTEDLEALLRESANLIDTLRKDVEPLGDPLAFVTGESGREELERLRGENKRLERKNKNLRESCDIRGKALERAEKNAERFRDALARFANEDNWYHPGGEAVDCCFHDDDIDSELSWGLRRNGQAYARDTLKPPKEKP